MRRWSIVLLVLAALGALGAWILSAPHPAYAPDQAEALEKPGDVANGKIIFFAGGCAACHATPGQSDPLRLGGGLELKSPYGSFFVPNISPDPDDGIGKWRVIDLANALQSGVSPGGEHYFPALPYTTYARARLSDIIDLMAFLRSLPPVQGKARPHEIRFPFNIRRGLGLWKLLFFRPGAVDDDSSQTQAWNRGHYLVEGLTHCAECHSPRNFLGAIITDRRYTGGPNPDGKGTAPNITSDAHGIGKWSKAELAEFLDSGLTPQFDSVEGTAMAPVIRNMAQLSDADRNAIAEYLKSIGAR